MARHLQKSVETSKAKNKNSHAFSRTDVLLLLAIIILSFTIRYVSIGDNGITYDEPVYVQIGSEYVYSIVHLDFSGDSWSLNKEHPPVSKYIYGTVIWLLNGPDYSYQAYLLAKLASAIMGILTCVIVYLLGREHYSRETGFASAIILSLSPVFLAHTQIAAIESPLTFFITLTVYVFMLAVKMNNKIYFLLSAITFGLVISTKYNGLIILPVLAIFFLIFTWLGLKTKAGTNNLRDLASNFYLFVPVTKIVIFLSVSILVFFIIWPWLWTDTISRLNESLSHWSNQFTIHQEYFLGSYVKPPVYYYPVYFMVTLPALLFIPLVAGIVGTVRSRNAFHLCILLWFLVPFAYTFSSYNQDGMRYIIFIYPAVALLCGYGLVKIAGSIARLISDRFRWMTREKVFAGITAIMLIYMVGTAALVYPYYLDYYNVFAGGLNNVSEHKLFKFGWWGEGIKESMDWIGSDAPDNATVVMLTQPYDTRNFDVFYHHQLYVTSLAEKNNVEYNFTWAPAVTYINGKRFEFIPDYLVLNVKMAQDGNVVFHDSSYRAVYNSTVKGVPIVTVYKKINSTT